MIRLASMGLASLALAAGFAGAAPPGPAFAQVRPAPMAPPQFRPVDVARIVSTMRVDLLADVLAAEIAAAGDPLLPDLPDAGLDEGWAAVAARIAPAAWIRAGLREGLEQGLATMNNPAERAAVAEALAFWESDLGSRVVLLEIGAREALLAPDVEAAARDSFAAAAGRNHPRVDQVRTLIAAADLVEPAVAASLNMALATLRGIQEGAGGIDPLLIEDIWLQEPEIRAEQTGWIEALIFMASAPLTDAEMARLVEEAGRPGSRRLGAMLNEAASTTFAGIARDLARASVMRQMGERL